MDAKIVIIVLLILFLYSCIKLKSNSKKCKIEKFAKPINTDTDTPKTLSLINFYTDWCGISQDFLPIWKEIADHINSDSNLPVKAYSIKCDTSPEHDKTCDDFNVQGYPTLKLIGKNSQEEYVGRRNKGSILEFVKSRASSE